MKTPTLCAALLVAIPVVAHAADATPSNSQAAAPAAAGRTPDVGEAAAKVQQALRESGFPAQDIVVSTHAETVLLTGHADSKADAARAVSAAEAAAGGTRVANQIEVREPASRQGATARLPAIEAALKQDSQTAELGILLSVDGNQVIGLHGLVPSAQSRAAAEQVARRAAETHRVRNYLVLPGE